MEKNDLKIFNSIDELIFSYIDFEKIKHVYFGKINHVYFGKINHNYSQPIQKHAKHLRNFVIGIILSIFLGVVSGVVKGYFDVLKSNLQTYIGKHLWAQILLGLIVTFIIAFSIYSSLKNSKNKILNLFFTTESNLYVFLIKYNSKTKEYTCYEHSVFNLSEIQSVAISSKKQDDWVQSNIDKLKFWNLLSKTEDSFLDARFYFANNTIETTASDVSIQDVYKSLIYSKKENIKIFIQFFRNNYQINN